MEDRGADSLAGDFCAGDCGSRIFRRGKGNRESEQGADAAVGSPDRGNCHLFCYTSGSLGWIALLYYTRL